jgi:hypothetical protein
MSFFRLTVSSWCGKLSWPYDVFCDELVLITGRSPYAGNMQSGKLNIIFHGILIELHNLCFDGIGFEYPFKSAFHFLTAACCDIREIQQTCPAINMNSAYCIPAWLEYRKGESVSIEDELYIE